MLTSSMERRTRSFYVVVVLCTCRAVVLLIKQLVFDVVVAVVALVVA